MVSYEFRFLEVFLRKIYLLESELALFDRWSKPIPSPTWRHLWWISWKHSGSIGRIQIKVSSIYVARSNSRWRVFLTDIHCVCHRYRPLMLHQSASLSSVMHMLFGLPVTFTCLKPSYHFLHWHEWRTEAPGESTWGKHSYFLIHFYICR